MVLEMQSKCSEGNSSERERNQGLVGVTEVMQDENALEDSAGKKKKNRGR